MEQDDLRGGQFSVYHRGLRKPSSTDAVKMICALKGRSQQYPQELAFCFKDSTNILEKDQMNFLKNGRGMISTKSFHIMRVFL